MSLCGLEHCQHWKHLSFEHYLTCQIPYEITDQTPAGMTHQTHSRITHYRWKKHITSYKMQIQPS